MNWISNVISSLFKYALILALTGGLAEATLDIMKKAASTQQMGLISLGKLNRSLVGPSHRHLPHHKPPYSR